MRTNTETYQASHGRKPRGHGHWWMLVETETTSFYHSGEGTMGKVREGAVHRARQNGRKATCVTVLP